MSRGEGPFSALPHARARGGAAEAAAARWLGEQGFEVVERNVRTDAGEIDLVAWEGATLAFIEVKARGSAEFGPAIVAVDARKQRRLARAAALYLALRGVEAPCRFDVLGMDAEGEGWRFTLVRDAFQAA